MLNDIRFQASNIIKFSTDINIGNNSNTGKNYQNTFEEIFKEQNTETKSDKTSNIATYQLGIPVGFDIDFSLLEEMENK